jgi:hypothetical protein
MTPHATLPEERRWAQLSRDREFPISGLVSVVGHALVLGLLLFGVFKMLFQSPERPAIDLDLVAYTEPGAGNRGHTNELAHGLPAAQDVASIVERQPARGPKLEQDVPVPKPETAAPKITYDPNGEPGARSLPEIPRLTPLLKGLPSGTSNKGDGGPGNSTGGIGKTDHGTGPGPDRVGTLKRQRQLRWTMLFSTRNAADYLDQLNTMGVILGIQEQDKTIRVIRDLGRRPALAEKADAPADRIFWLDDDPKSVAAMAEELQLRSMPWRIVAFFPESIEQQLLGKELLYGKSFGRNSEEQIKETKFRVEIRYGQVRITVVEQH